MTEPTLIVELGVAEAYELLLNLGQSDLPPLDAIENEDWGRDWLLQRIAALPALTLEAHGLTRDDGWDRADSASTAPGPDDSR